MKITLELEAEEAVALFERVRKPNKVDDFIEPLRAVRRKLAKAMGIDPEIPRA